MALESQQRVGNPGSICMPSPHGAMSRCVHRFVHALRKFGVWGCSGRSPFVGIEVIEGISCHTVSGKAECTAAAAAGSAASLSAAEATIKRAFKLAAFWYAVLLNRDKADDPTVSIAIVFVR